MYGFSNFSHVKESVKSIPLFKANWNKKVTFFPWERCCTEKIGTHLCAVRAESENLRVGANRKTMKLNTEHWKCDCRRRNRLWA